MGFTRRERLLVGTVSLVLLVRVFGISLVAPSFTTYGVTLTQDLLLVGLAFGAYAVSMALFQIPFGRMSDRWGRRRVMVFGLLVSFAGSLACAFAPSIGWLIAARLLQGAGAVNGVAMALVGDRIPDERRTVANAIVGVSIGGAFVLGVLLGARLEAWRGVPGLFEIQAALSLLALGLVLAAVPQAGPASERTPRLREILGNPDSGRMAVASFAIGLLLNVALLAIPLLALELRPLERGSLALTPMVIIGGLSLLLTARLADKGHQTPVARFGFLALALAPAAILYAPTWGVFIAAGGLFFAAHSTLSALLPTLASRLGGENGRGALLGAYNVSQYLGSSAAGLLVGVFLPHPGALAPSLLALAALVVAVGLLGTAAAVPLARRTPARAPTLAPPVEAVP